MPICIAGMHRSGTSMVAGRLRASGLYLGPPDWLMPATPDNAMGYCEDLRFVALNDAILRAYGGAWDAPPPMTPAAAGGWKRWGIQAIARHHVRRFKVHELWGWKDPRNCLTLPFWVDLIPDLKVVICLRHPIEVERSLRTRRRSACSDGIRLWRIYNERLLAATTCAPRVVTHYDAHFRDPIGELDRLLDFIGIAAREAHPELVRSDLRRHDCAGAPLSEHDADADTRQLYARMCAEAA